VGEFVFNRAKGRGTEWAERVNSNDPTNAIVVVALVAEEGVESDATLKDKDDFGALVSGATNFATNTGGSRKTIDQSGGMTITYDDTNDRTDVDIPDQTWTALANDGTGKVSDIVTGYDSDSTGGADANILPWTFHDFAVTPDGSDVTVKIAEAGFFRAS
jgi:hypothetical protein